MALSRITKIAPGGSNTFAVSFALGYGDEADVTARVGAEVDGLGAPVYRTIDFSVPGFMTLAGATIAATTPVVFERTESRWTLDVDWSDGANITDENLNAAQLQALRLVQEALDGRFEGITQDIDMVGHRLVGLPEPTDADEAATKSYADTKIATGSANAAAAAASAADALASKGAAATSAGTASTQAGIATTQAGNASTSAAAAAASASAINLPAPVASTFLQRNAGNTAYDTKTVAQMKIALGMESWFNVKSYGAVADDATDSTAAFQAAINAALAVGGGVVYIPTGFYWFANASAELDPGVGFITFLGDGFDASVLHFEEGTAVGTFTAPLYKCIFKNAVNTFKGSIRFEGLQFSGTLVTDNIRQGGVPIWLDYYSDVVIKDCKFKNLTGMAMDIHYCQRFECTGSWLENLAADGVRARDTPNVIVDGNYIIRNGDDAIAIHTSDGFSPSREGVIITNNHIVNAGSIKVLGGRVVNVSNNRIELGNIAGITVSTAAGGQEGNIPVRDVIIANNHLLDMLYIPVGGVPSSGLAMGINVIASDAVGQASTHSVRPGRYDLTGTAWVFPWNYDDVDTDNVASVVPPVMGVRIAGNIIRRTRPAVATFSLYGYGNRLMQGVAYNPAITDAHLRAGAGVNMSGSFADVMIVDNIVESMGSVIVLGTPTYNEQYERFLIARNTSRDIINFGVTMGNVTVTQDITIADNDFDIDTYRQNANSNVNGTYATDSVPRGINSGNTPGLKVLRNRFRNCCRAVSTNVTDSLLIQDNIIVGLPLVVGFNTTNKGMGFVEIPGPRFNYEVIDADPTSATYLALTNFQLVEASAMPTTGRYVAGWFVKNTSPSALSGLLGWMRLTTGTAHVLGTDWSAVGKLVGTATYDPPSLADGAGTVTNVTVSGAAMGDAAVASFSLDTAGITVTAAVSAANTVTVRFQNETGGVLDIASGTLKATVFKS